VNGHRATPRGSHELKGPTTITVCLPAHNEAATVGLIVKAIRTGLVDDLHLVDEIVVLDDHSTDDTAAIATEAGATVIPSDRVLPQFGARRGKGEALWKSLAAIHSDIIVWVDADIVDFEAHFVSRLVEPLLLDPELMFVKGYYDRPVGAAQVSGGRVTELLARPALSLFHPDLATYVQPLSGEFAARRAALQDIPFAAGYGVDVALLIDVVDRYGHERVAQADLGVRVHRNRPLDELGPQALEVLHAILRRAGQPVPGEATLVRPGRPPVQALTDDRPALSEIPASWLDD
jgi:glucosyl-3-phosphoglycerate synthase